MIRQFVAFSLVALLALTAGHAGGQDGKKLAELDGTWAIIKMEIEGKSLLEKGERWKLLIKDVVCRVKLTGRDAVLPHDSKRERQKVGAVGLP